MSVQVRDWRLRERERERGNACYCFHENTLGEEFDLNSLSAGQETNKIIMFSPNI